MAVVHDLIPLGMPEQYLGRPWRRAWYRASLRRLRRCAAVVAVSGHTAEALRRGGYAISPRVVANSVPAFSGSAEADLVRSGPVMAFAGHGPSKNPRLLAEVAKRYYALTGERIAVVGQADLEGTVSLGRLADSSSLISIAAPGHFSCHRCSRASVTQRWRRERTVYRSLP